MWPKEVRRIQRLAHTLKRQLGLIPPGVQHALQADEQGSRRAVASEPPPTVARPDPGLRSSAEAVGEPESAPVPGAFSKPGLRCLLRAREVPAVEIDKLEVLAPSLWIRPLRLLVGHARFLKPSDMQTNRGHPVMGPLKLGCTARTCSSAAIASACWKFFAGLHRIKARAKCPSGNAGSSIEGPAAVVFRLLQPRRAAGRIRSAFASRHETARRAPAQIRGHARRL